MKSKHSILINLLIVVVILALANGLSSYVYQTIDLTEEKRFTLTQPSVDMLKNLKSPVYAQLFLAGKLPLEFQRLQTAVIDQLNQYVRISHGKFQYELIDPLAGTPEEDKKFQEDMAQINIYPVNIRVMESDETVGKRIYPHIIFRVGTRTNQISILESEAVSVSPDVQLNNSISLLEYKYSNAIQKLLTYQKPNIAFLAGHGELEKYQTYDLEVTLQKFYNTGRLFLDSVYSIDQRIELVIVPQPKSRFNERDKFILDQYLMKGGKLLWLVDRINVNLDSLRRSNLYVPFEFDLNLDDFFFKHGWRINPDLIQDLECTRIPLKVSQEGGRNQFELFPWFYHILAVPKAGHAATNNLDRVNLFFPSTIDTLKTKHGLKHEIVLTSSAYSRFQMTPLQLDMNVVRIPPVIEKFNKPYLPIAVVSEGNFASLYENRVTESMRAGLAQLNETFEAKSVSTRMMLVADGDIAVNRLKQIQNEYWPLGYNIYEGRSFANKDFLLNSIEYLLGKNSVLSARTKEVKLRLLNVVKAKQEKTKWQIVNVILPIGTLILFGIAFYFSRKYKYGRANN